MSGLELVAGIAGVAAAAIKVSMAMNDLAEELGSAGRDVRYIGNDMAGFSQVLRLVQSSLEESIRAAGSTVIQSVLDTLPQLVEQCKLVYDEANGLMIAIKPSNGKESSINFFQRMKFVFYKGRITILRSLLDSSKSTLNLLLVTLNIEMAKHRMPDKALMDQLQNERKAFIRVVYSQNKALDEAMKEVEKAKKEAAKFKSKRDKEKEKENKDNAGDLNADSEDINIEFPKRNSTPYSYKPPPPYTLHSAPSVSQLVYQPPSIERFNSVRNSSKAVTTLALSLEPTRPPSTYGMPTPPTSPPDNGSYGSQPPFTPYPPQPPNTGQSEPETAPKPPHVGSQDGSNTADSKRNARPDYTSKRVFSDPGPVPSSSTSKEHLDPGNAPRERSRSPYGFSRVPQDEIPKMQRKRPASQASPQDTGPTNPAQNGNRTFSTPPYGSNNMGSVPEVPEPASGGPRSTTTSQTTEQRKPSFTYHPPPPPPPPAYPDGFDGFFNAPPPERPKPTAASPPTPTPPPVHPNIFNEFFNTSPSEPPKPAQASPSPPPKPSIPPPPPPRHGTTYIVLEPYLSHEIGHLSLVPFDTLVDVIAHIPETTDLPYPTAFDGEPTHFWQASLGHRRGPRGLFPVSTVCSIDDERVTTRIVENWFAEEGVGFIADGQGRCWVGLGWEWEEPKRRRSKWWAEEF